MRQTTALGSSWRFIPRFDEAFADPSFDASAWAAVDLPHTNLELPYNAFDERSYQFVSTYVRDVELPPLSGGARAFVDFEGVMAACDVWVNGKAAGGHKGGYTPFSVELTAFAKPGTNRLVLRVDSTERADIPPFGHVIDYLCYGGVYRGVTLRLTDSAFIADVFARPMLVGPAQARRLEADIRLDMGERSAYGSGGTAAGNEGLSYRATLIEPSAQGSRAIAESSGAIRDGGTATFAVDLPASVRLWDIDDPALYDLEIRLLRDGIVIDSKKRRIGFRSAEWRPDGFFLNGKRRKIVGLNRHQAWPYAGYAMPARAQRRDAEILKRELGVNLVRASHYPQAAAFLDACDELGLLVFEELPGWQHIGDAEWKDNACASLEEMILRDRSRPSVVIWGVRINESKDDHEFYARTNAIARRLDPGRATGGVRYLENSELLEDVYTFNDFLHNGTRPPLRDPRKVMGKSRGAPYLVTEHTGHMFPTKRFDNEERLAEHALRHARVLNAAMGDESVAGAIGWVAFDYNTHSDFGSGDRICYHGVSDMFRIPKYAAALYASQRDPSAGIVMEAASVFAKGERSAAVTLPFQIYTNCDEIVISRGSTLIGSFYPDRKAFGNLPHPPVVITDMVRERLAGSGFSRRDQALIKNKIEKILTLGYESFNTLDMLSLGLFLLRHRMSLADGAELLGKYTLGWGTRDENWELVGLIGGKEVARRTYCSDGAATALVAKADDGAIAACGSGALGSGDDCGEAWDCTRVELRLVDQYGNLCPFASECVDITVKGPGRVIGPSRVALIGGCLAFWIRGTGEKGLITVDAAGTRFSAEPTVIEAI